MTWLKAIGAVIAAIAISGLLLSVTILQYLAGIALLPLLIFVVIYLVISEDKEINLEKELGKEGAEEFKRFMDRKNK